MFHVEHQRAVTTKARRHEGKHREEAEEMLPTASFPTTWLCGWILAIRLSLPVG